MDEEYRRRLREDEEAGFQPLDGSLGSDHKSSSSGARDDSYKQQYPSGVQNDVYGQPSHTHQEPYSDENGFMPRENWGTDQFLNQPNKGFSSHSDHSPTQPNRDSGYMSNRNSRPSHLEPDHSRQSSDSYFNQNPLNEAQENIDIDKMNASFEKSPFFSPKHKQKDAKGMNLRPLSDLFLDESDGKGRDENFNMKPSHYPGQNAGNGLKQYGRWENTPQSRYSYDSTSFHQQGRRTNDAYGAPDTDYDAYTGRNPRLYKGYSENLAQPQSQWHDLKTPQERQEKLRSDRYGTLSETRQKEGPAESSSPRQQGRGIMEMRPGGHNQSGRGFSSMEPRQLQREESLKQLYEWKERINQQYPSQSHPQSGHNPIYENLNTSYDSGPGRPPLPAAYRDKIVQVLYCLF